MDRYSFFRTWAPPESPWSLWAKPSVFAHWSETFDTSAIALPENDGSWLPSPAERCAVVVDAPGIEAVILGLAAAARGYRPVPLFNSCPARPEDYLSVASSMVDAKSVLLALAAGTPRLAALEIPRHAPPAFLLDSNRCPSRHPAKPMIFDNRSVVFAADFPSSIVLHREMIRRAMIVHEAGSEIGDDLRHALRHWRDRGLPVAAISTNNVPIDLAWPNHGWWNEVRQRFFAMTKLRRNAVGGFGGIVPDSSGG